MSLHTRICDVFGIEFPIVLAGMGGASNPDLVAAVSNAGGLGILGAATCGPDRLRAWIRRTRELTDRPFGVDTLLPASVRRGAADARTGPSPADRLPEYQKFAAEFMEREKLGVFPAPAESQAKASGKSGLESFSKDFFDSQMQVVIEERVPVYAAGLGSPGPWVERLHEQGTVVMSVVGAVRHAHRAVESGVDVIVAQGHDAGGHNSPIGTMALVPQVVDAAGDIPVLAAGGIGDGRGIAAALMLGAEGVWLGTAFLGTEEAGIQDFQKEALVDSSEEGTTISRSVTGKPTRVIRNAWARAWEETDLEPLPMPFQSMVSSPVVDAATRQQRVDIVPGFAGQGVGMIQQIRPAGEVLRELAESADQVLRRAESLRRV
jgi:NAD(P)H-dependent flavin oxidoreductase YrpB (nitropropane dioxygenase family)